MKLHNAAADIFVPDGTPPEAAFAQVTDLCVAAHQDDAEIMAYNAIADCYQRSDRLLCVVVLTDGGGSPRSGAYAGYTNEQIHIKRSQEQRDAARIGGYLAVQLAWPSEAVRTGEKEAIEEELAALFLAMCPAVVYLHNPADRHETHLGAFLRALGALRRLPRQARPQKLYGMEVWRTLDWLSAEDKVVFDTARYPELAEAVITAYESQCTPQKRFDRAALGRRYANATFSAPRECDETDACNFGMDLTLLLEDDGLSPADFIMEKVRHFADDVQGLLTRFM